MWGDRSGIGYGQVKFDTSSQAQVNAQAVVKAQFNSEVRANKFGPNPGYRKESEIFASSTTKRPEPRPQTKLRASMQLTPACASPSRPQSKVSSRELEAIECERANQRRLQKGLSCTNTKTKELTISKVATRAFHR